MGWVLVPLISTENPKAGIKPHWIPQWQKGHPGHPFLWRISHSSWDCPPKNGHIQLYLDSNVVPNKSKWKKQHQITHFGNGKFILIITKFKRQLQTSLMLQSSSQGRRLPQNLSQVSQECVTTQRKGMKISASSLLPCFGLRAGLFPSPSISSEVFTTAGNCQERSTRQERRKEQPSSATYPGWICLKTFVKWVCSPSRQREKPCLCQKNLSQGLSRCTEL